jgi:hypothetical protein
MGPKNGSWGVGTARGPTILRVLGLDVAAEARADRDAFSVSERDVRNVDGV